MHTTHLISSRKYIIIYIQIYFMYSETIELHQMYHGAQSRNKNALPAQTFKICML